MKCPKCGFRNHPSATRCVKCRVAFMTEAQVSAEQESARPVATVPEWRKEVTRKAREYGERKKVLTTPPHPLKERETETHSHDVAVAAEEPVYQNLESAKLVEPEEELPPPSVSPTKITPAIAPSPEPSSHRPLSAEFKPHPALEFELQQIPVIEPDFESEIPEELPLHLGRRGASLLVDHAILGVLAYVVLFFCREVLSYDLKTVFQSAPLPVTLAILLFHFFYYFYFYKTARQTPGQVFFSLEVRDPLSGFIGTGKVFIRWAALVFLNIFNLLPLLFGKNYILLDRLSGTEVRSFNESN